MSRRDPRHPADSAAVAADRLALLGLPSTRRGGWVPEAAEVAEVIDISPSMAAQAPAPVVVSPVDVVRDWLKDRAPVWSHPALDRMTVGSAITTVAAVIAASIALVMVLHHRAAASYSGSGTNSSSVTGGSAGPAPDPVPSASYSSSSSTDSASIVVDVGGRVRKPGLVTLPTGARVADAIAAAGGPLRHRELAATNLAARVTDGQLLVVGEKAAAPSDGGAADSSTSPSSAAPVDLNAATLEQLETLPGIGPVTGQKIIDWRTAHSGFTSIEQLQQVSGIGPATYAELSPLVTL